MSWFDDNGDIPVDTGGYGPGDNPDPYTTYAPPGGDNSGAPPTGYPGGVGTSPTDTSGGDGGSGLDLGSIAKMLGFSNVGSLMSALAPFLGGALAYNATNKATGQMQQGIQNSNEAITKILGGTSPYAPYMQAGQTALGNLGNIGYKPMAGNYQPLGAGRAMTLGQMARK